MTGNRLDVEELIKTETAYRTAQGSSSRRGGGGSSRGHRHLRPGHDLRRGDKVGRLADESVQQASGGNNLANRGGGGGGVFNA